MPKLSASEYEELISSISEAFSNSTRLRQFARKEYGKNNLWMGASGYKHQIDASLKSDEEILLVECKHWTKPITPGVFFDFFGRLIDIRNHPKYNNKSLRGTIVTKTGWTTGVETAIKYYSQFCSVFIVNEVSEIEDMIHTHYIAGAGGIQSEGAVGQPTIIQEPTNSDNDIIVKRSSPADITISWKK